MANIIYKETTTLQRLPELVFTLVFMRKNCLIVALYGFSNTILRFNKKRVKGF